MPQTPHQVYGTVKFSGTNQLVEGATVVVTDTTLDESVSGVTNSSGQYLLNLSKLKSAWSQGDGLSIEATISNRSKTDTTTISGGANHVNLVLDITTYPDYTDKTPEQPISFSALDIMDSDKTFTWGTSGNSNNRIIKEVANYGKFTITKYFKYNSSGRPINESRVVE